MEIIANLMPFLPWSTTPVYRFHPLESCIKCACLHFIALEARGPLTSTPTPSAVPKGGAFDHEYVIRFPSASMLAWRCAALCLSMVCSLVSCIAAELIFRSCNLLHRDFPTFAWSTRTWPFALSDANSCLPSDVCVSILSPLQLLLASFMKSASISVSIWPFSKPSM